MLFSRARRGKGRAEPAVELLGTVSVPSGDLLLIDFGLLRLWSADEQPVLDPALVGEDVAETANASVDLEIVGPDAGAVAAQIDLAFLKGRYAFDVPPGNSVVEERVRDVTRATGLEASLRPLDRVPHRERVRLLLHDSPEGAEVPFHGGWAVAVHGLPTDRRLRVLGERVAAGPDADRWQSVWVEVADGQPDAVQEAGYVLVDEARLLWADPDALSVFRSDEAPDALADVVLWGRDAELVAHALEAPLLEDEQYGWLDLPVDRAIELGHVLQERRRPPEVLFAFDVRPHDDHYRLLAQMRATPTESGALELDGATVTGFMTSWGDGAFPVYRDLDRDGALLRVRVELGAPEVVTRHRRFEELWFGWLSQLALVSTRLTADGATIGWMTREEPDNEDDSGWRLFAGDESQEFLDDPSHVEAVPLRELLQLDDALEPLLQTPAPAAFERREDGELVAVPPPPTGVD